jgi:hypothetical protein
METIISRLLAHLDHEYCTPSYIVPPPHIRRTVSCCDRSTFRRPCRHSRQVTNHSADESLANIPQHSNFNSSARDMTQFFREREKMWGGCVFLATTLIIFPSFSCVCPASFELLICSIITAYPAPQPAQSHSARGNQNQGNLGGMGQVPHTVT